MKLGIPGARGLTVLGAAIMIMLLVGTLGSFYEDKRQDKSRPATVSEITSEPDPAKDWAEYKDPAGFFEFKHPRSWALPADAAKCEPGRIMLGANEESAGTCAEGNTGQMLVQAVKGELLRSTFEPIEPYFDESEVKWESINVDGEAGLKVLGTVVTPNKIYPGLAAGDKLLVYIFQKEGHTFVARYYIKQANPYPDVQADFETLVLKTLKFTK